ncbi:MAG TPA: hypothetical protein ENF48_11775 [Desulfobacteraceae bacterium]|nr:MAG: hypothetical protein DRH76_06795 [Deltaproteobacteria bacterium]HDI61009.1 hypothetical protein [Desulfobacteraceae bacterium]
MGKAAASRFEPAPTVGWDRGLCATCIHQDTCGLRSRQAAPVVFCEEFTPTAPGSRTAPAAPRLRPVASPPSGQAAEEWIGLCKSCANHHHCTLRKPIGGVWHCEEFA